MSFLFELDHPKDQASAVFVGQVGKHLQRAVVASGASQNEIAERLGVNKSHVSRSLSGFNNLTLKTLAEFAWALDSTVKIVISPKEIEEVQAPEVGNSNVIVFLAQQTNPDLSHQEQTAVADTELLYQAYA
ncbi:XRE family transcriptional regulator [Agrobacterium rosae]|uniref:XRE family transcriptional regulator n=1 Tax=Agrobacterium rosae TaxID=1972867 RepID=A0ABU4VVU2_9HYPH|nr:XRE family transcriptional regulator [Agrobacterium rosae]MDX8329615.1 XRE family transcriptional regulator [Agrobacterium rosae]